MKKALIIKRGVYEHRDENHDRYTSLYWTEDDGFVLGSYSCIDSLEIKEILFFLSDKDGEISDYVNLFGKKLVSVEEMDDLLVEYGYTLEKATIKDVTDLGVGHLFNAFELARLKKGYV